jgi:hypothetical protein
MNKKEKNTYNKLEKFQRIMLKGKKILQRSYIVLFHVHNILEKQSHRNGEQTSS